MSEVKKKNAPAEPKRTSHKTYKKYKPVLEKMQEDSQCYLILRHILEHGSITPKEAEKGPIYSMRLSARVWDLRKIHGVPIETTTIVKKRGKKHITYASYYIGG